MKKTNIPTTLVYAGVACLAFGTLLFQVWFLRDVLAQGAMIQRMAAAFFIGFDMIAVGAWLSELEVFDDDED